MGVQLIVGAPAAGDVTGALSAGQSPSDGTSNVPAVNTAAVITYAAVPGQRHRLTMLAFSYAPAPAGGRITVTDGGTTILDLDVTGATDREISLPPGGLRGTVNTAMTATLAAGGAAVQGKLSAAKITG